MKLDGFGVFVNDPEAQIEFYHDILGFEIKETASDKNVYLEKDGTLFLMYGRTDLEGMTGSKFGFADGVNGHFEIAPGVENYAAVDKNFADIIAKGAKPIMQPTTMLRGHRTCYIADPEGNLIEIGSFAE